MALNNSQYDALMRVYQRNQIENRHKQEKKIEEVYRAIPQIEQFDREIAAVSLDHAKKLLNGDANALTRLRERLAELREEKATLLSMKGFSPDYMDPVYTCEDCHDTGYVNGKKCHCFRQAEIEILYGESNLEKTLETESFEHLSFEYYDRKTIVDKERGYTQLDYMKQVVDGCHHYVENFHEKGGNLLFTGPAGTGKTFLTNCIAGALLSRAEAVLYLTASDLFQMISDKRFDREEEGREEKYRGILECDLLIIDDLGTELNNSFTNSELFYLINRRFQEGKATVISTNLTMNQILDTYSERIFSRIVSSYRVIRLFGEDIRIKKRLGDA